MACWLSPFISPPFLIYCLLYFFCIFWESYHTVSSFLLKPSKIIQEKESLLYLPTFCSFHSSWFSSTPFYHFFYVWRTSCSYCSRVGLLVTDFLSFPSFVGVLISLSLLKHILSGYRILGWQFFFFQTLEKCFWASKIWM